jgi:hypothetical protein
MKDVAGRGQREAFTLARLPEIRRCLDMNQEQDPTTVFIFT